MESVLPHLLCPVDEQNFLAKKLTMLGNSQSYVGLSNFEAKGEKCNLIFPLTVKI